MSSMIAHTENKFSKTVDEQECLLEYEFHGTDRVVFYHTYVPESLRGQGLAMEIIREGLEWAAAKNYKVIPACSAVRTFIERNPEYKQYLT
ncbi:MAG: GNAT family N-acetyltransferase [Bacteroidales bacterium]